MSHAVNTVWVVALCAAMLPRESAHAANMDQISRLKRLSVEELLDVEVTSVSRREQGLRDAPAAISVVTAEDLRRSGATSLPEALRAVPGLHVARQDASTWAVSARGFSSVNSEKLLVLSDTRSIYTPLFSGVHWDVQDYLLEDVERIEVIRGPGAALWGSNAVNGVINVTTRSARQTHGAYLEAGGGEFDRFWLGARYGAETQGGRHYRLFGRVADRAARRRAGGSDDAWRIAHVGFRTDWDGAQDQAWTVQGDVYSGRIGQLAPSVEVIGRPGPAAPLEADVSGGNLLARWRQRTGDGSDVQVRAYYDYTHRDDPSFLDTLHTFDVDVQQRLVPHAKHDLIWGAALRLTSNRNRGRGIFAVLPDAAEDLRVSGFLQDQIAVSEDFALTLGTKLEHNDFSGWEVQPSLRASWTLERGQVVWAAVSRAVRVPTRIERDVAIDVTDPAGDPVLRLLGNPDFDAERLVAYEAGIRWQPHSQLSFDVALFFNDYDRLASLEIGTPFAEGARTIVPILTRNLSRGRSHGGELLAEWQPDERWRLSASYAHVDLQLESSGQDLNRGVWLEDATPRSQVALRSLLTLGAFEIDAQARHHTRIRRLPLDPSGAGIGAYTALDVRLGWQPAPDWRISVVAQNLLDDEHVEFGTPAARAAHERAAYVKAEWRRE